MDNKQIQIFKCDDGSTIIEVQVDKETVWLNQYQISDLFLTDRTSIGRHISNIYKTKELDENSTSVLSNINCRLKSPKRVSNPRRAGFFYSQLSIDMTLAALNIY